MSKKTCKVLSYTFLLLLLMPVAALGDEHIHRYGLLLVGHGSRSQVWTKAALHAGNEACGRALRTAKFVAARTAFMEHSKPTVADAVAELEAAGCEHIIAVPLFIMSTDHTHFDLPAILGQYVSPELHDHGGAVHANVPITLTGTMSSDRHLLSKYALDQILKLSQSPEKEAIVLLAHGSPTHELLCDRVMRRVATYCCGKSGIDYADWAYVKVGQTFEVDGLPTIRRAAASKDRVIVVGLYFSLSAQRLHDRVIGDFDDGNSADGHHSHGGKALGGKEIIFSEEGIVMYPGLIDWVVESAVNATKQLAPTHDDHHH